jgi:protein-tyrosine phosphatase
MSNDIYPYIHSNITKNIWITGWQGSINPTLLKQNNIKTVVCLNLELQKKAEDLKMYKDLGIEHYYFLMDDMPDVQIDGYLDRIYDVITKSIKRGPVLVHCTMGISRSVTAVMSVILRKTIHKRPDVNTDKILDYVKKRRPCAQPNQGFYIQLKKYEEKLRNRTPKQL